MEGKNIGESCIIRCIRDKMEKAHCWFCDTDKEFDCKGSTKWLAYGSPHPCLELTVRGSITTEGNVKSFVCEECRNAILRTIGESKVASIENVNEQRINQLKRGLSGAKEELVAIAKDVLALYG